MTCDICSDHAKAFVLENFEAWLEDFGKADDFKGRPSNNELLLMRCAFQAGIVAGLSLSRDATELHREAMFFSVADLTSYAERVKLEQPADPDSAQKP